MTGALPTFVPANCRFEFLAPAEVSSRHPAVGTLSVPDPVSWADANRDVAARLGNPLQRSAHAALSAMAADVRSAAARGRTDLLDAWRKLTTSDHTYSMPAAAHSDAEVREYFSPFDSPHEAYVIFINALRDLRRRVDDTRLTPAPVKKPRGRTT